MCSLMIKGIRKSQDWETLTFQTCIYLCTLGEHAFPVTIQRRKFLKAYYKTVKMASGSNQKLE